MKQEYRLLTITLSGGCLYLVLCVITFVLFILKIDYPVSYGSLFIPLILVELILTIRVFLTKRGLFVRYEGKIRKISLKVWDTYY